MYHQGVVGAKALATLKALKLKISTAVLVVLNMTLIRVYYHKVHLHLLFIFEALATLETIVNKPLPTLEFHLESWVLT